MTTHAIIEMRKGGMVRKNVNYDADGYPDNVMPEIQYFANMFFTNRAEANESLEWKYNTDYLYRVYINDNKIVVKTYYVTFKGELSFIEVTKYTKSGDKLKEEKTLGKQHIKENKIKEDTHTIKYYELREIK